MCLRIEFEQTQSSLSSMSKQIEPHILDVYKPERLVGSGAYGHVWKVIQKKTQKEFALKKIFDAFQNSTDAQRTYRQITVLQELCHSNIIKLQRVIRAKNNKDLYLVFEYMEADLHSIVGQDILEPVHHRFIIYQILRALKYLHSAHLIHRDLKPSNVLINSQCQEIVHNQVKICDFGLVRSLVPPSEQQQEVILSEEVATRWYRSPEILLGSQMYGKPVDMWSVGCIIVEMLTGQPFFPGNSTLDQLERILTFTGRPSKADIDSLESTLAQQLISQIPTALKRQSPSIPPQFLELVERLIQFNPNKRITVQEAISMSLFDEFRDQFDEAVCSRVIIPPVDDNIRLGLKKYREIIYQDIKRRYPSIKEKKKSQERSTSKKKKGELRESQKTITVISATKSPKRQTVTSSHKSLKKQSIEKSCYSNNNGAKKRKVVSPGSNGVSSHIPISPISPCSGVYPRASPYIPVLSGSGNSVLKQKGGNSTISVKKSMKMYDKKLMRQKADNLRQKQRLQKMMGNPSAMLSFEDLHKLYKYLK